MISVILCNRVEPLQSWLKRSSFPLRYISLVENRDSQAIRSYLRQVPHADELPKAELFRNRNADFRWKYIQFMAQLNAANHSLFWWAMAFTNKNPLATSLCRNTAFFLAVTELAKCDSRPLLVVTDNTDLADQVAYWARSQGIQPVNLLKVPGAWRRLFKRHTPAGIIRSALRTFALWWLSGRYRLAPNLENDHTVVSTLTHPRSFVSPNGYQDAYFGPLVERGVDHQLKPIVLAMLVERPFQQLKMLKGVTFLAPIVPMESCVTLRDLIACTLRCLGISLRPLRLRGSMEIDGKDISHLLNGTVNEARRSGDLFLNLRVYYAAKWLSRNIRIARCLYPFENRSWEKMLLLGMRHGSPKTRLLGYQHASLTPSHTNFMLGPREAAVTPLPDSIFTTGEVVTRWLESEGNYPPGMFKTACALRQSPSTRSFARTKGASTRVLVALASSLQEYVETLAFLEPGLAGREGFEVRIRPHPEFPLQLALDLTPLSDTGFYSESVGSLADDLEWADVVLYASSTVGLEAVSMGIPAVYLDLGGYLDTDPMYGWDEFRWSVSDPAELPTTIQLIRDLPDDEFEDLQTKGNKYVADYLKPVTPDGLAAFWED